MNLITGLLGLGLISMAVRALMPAREPLALVPDNISNPEPPVGEIVSKVTDFAHGGYGDDTGVVFFGSIDGVSFDRMEVSDHFIDPLFGAILTRGWRNSDGGGVPRLVSEWNMIEGWRDGCERVKISATDFADLAAALDSLGQADTAEDFEEYFKGWPIEGRRQHEAECLRCAAAIREFLGSRLARGMDIFIQRD